MKTALILLVVMAAYAAARSLNDKQAIDKGFNLPCGRQNIGKRYTYIFSPHKYLECTRKGLELKKCDRGTWYSSDAKECIGQEDSGECEPEAPISESEEPAPESSESAEIEPTEPAPESEESVEIEPTEPAPESEESVEIEPTEPAPESSESVEIEPTEPAPESSESVEIEPTEPAPESSESEEVPEPEPTDAPAPECKVECAYNGEYLVDPASCHGFYQCSWGKPERFDCPYLNNQTLERLVFDPSLDVCVWPENYECTGTPGCQQPEPEPECPSVKCDYLGEYLSNPADCHSFYQCSYAADHSLFPYLHNCAIESGSNRLVFDPSINVCNWSYAVDCKVDC